MLAAQRQREILTRLGDLGGVRVRSLAQSLNVTEETIRRDLQKLGTAGKLLRIHGGAVPAHDDRRDLPFDLRKTAKLEEKRAIATAALRYVAEGDVIALDASSTAYELARILPDMPLTLVTNSLPIGVALLGCRHLRVVSTGGNLGASSRSFTGSLAEEALGRFNVNKLFFSSKGFDLTRGLSDVSDEQARVKRRMIDVAETKYLLADHSKFGVRSVVFFASLEDVDLVITDERAATAVIDEVIQRGLKVETAAECTSNTRG